MTEDQLSPHQIRLEVKRILDQYGFGNSFRLKKVDFYDLARDEAYFVVIKDWQPNPIAKQIQNDIRKATQAIAQFQGNFVG